MWGTDRFWGLPRTGRLAGMPVSDTMSASPGADRHGATAAARSYRKLDYGAHANGTMLNMWISKKNMVAP